MRRLRFLLTLLIATAIAPSLLAQTEADSLELLVLRDSMLNEINRNADRQAIEVGQELLRQATDKEYYFFMIEAHLNMARAYNFINEPDSSIISNKRAFNIAAEQNMFRGMSASTTNTAITFFQGGAYDSAEYYFQVAVNLAKEYAPDRLAINLSNMAWIYGVMDDREREFEAYLASLKALEENPDSFRAYAVKGMTLGGMGDYYVYNEEYEKAREAYEEKLVLGEERNDLRMQYEAHAGLGNLLRQDENYDFEESKRHWNVAASDTIPRNGHYKHQAIQGLAKLYWKDGRKEEALGYFRQVYDYYNTIKVKDFSASAATAIGQLHLELNDLSQADRWLTTALAATKQGNLIARERDALKSMYKVDSLRGRYRSALGRFQRMNQINDSLSSERSKNRIKELEIQYETEQTANENLALKSDLELKEAQVERQQIIQVFVVVVAITFIVLALVIYRNYQRKIKANDIISQQADELKKLSRFKDGLTSMVVHDMRNPLNAILGFSQGTPTDDKQKNINRSGHQVLNLVNNMLDIQRFEEAKVEVNPELVNAKQLVTETIQEISLIAASKSLKLINRIPEALQYRIDPVLMNRVLVNLLINSVKYSKSGGEIIIEVGEGNEGFQELVVRDEGHGIPSDQLPFIFNKFWHNDPGRSGILPSTGLGLSFSKLATEAHGGSIRAESVLHEGTSIFLSLPLGDKAVAVSTKVEGETSLELAFEPEDEAIYTKYLPQLEKLKVFEVSEINRLLKIIEGLVSDNRFGTQLRTAAFQGDQGQYDRLLAQIRK